MHEDLAGWRDMWRALGSGRRYAVYRRHFGQPLPRGSYLRVYQTTSLSAPSVGLDLPFRVTSRQTTTRQTEPISLADEILTKSFQKS